MKKTVIGAIALLGAMAVTPVSAKETISAVGSSSVTPLMEVFSETYMKTNPERIHRGSRPWLFSWR